MEELKLTRKVYDEAIENIEKVSEKDAYLNQFEVDFVDGLNTASVMEICRIINDSSFESKVRLMKICIEGKNVKVKCPNGDVESFRLGSSSDGLDGIPLFQKEPFALAMLADVVYGYVLKKSIRFSGVARPKSKTE
jgi:hypothetical protein